MAAAQTILVIDDEPIIRYVLRTHLSSLEYIVIEAGDAETALGLYEQFGTHIDLVMLDLKLPSMSGRQCLEVLKRANPQVRVIITTGTYLDEDLDKWLEAGAVGVLEKPFDLSRVTALVAGALKE